MTEKPPYEFGSSKVQIDEVQYKVLNVLNNIKLKNEINADDIFDFSKLSATIQFDLKFDDFFEEFVKEARKNLFSLTYDGETYTNVSLEVWWNTESILIKWTSGHDENDRQIGGEFIIKHGNDKL